MAEDYKKRTEELNELVSELEDVFNTVIDEFNDEELFVNYYNSVMLTVREVESKGMKLSKVQQACIKEIKSMAPRKTRKVGQRHR